MAWASRCGYLTTNPSGEWPASETRALRRAAEYHMATDRVQDVIKAFPASIC